MEDHLKRLGRFFNIKKIKGNLKRSIKKSKEFKKIRSYEKNGRKDLRRNFIYECYGTYKKIFDDT